MSSEWEGKKMCRDVYKCTDAVTVFLFFLLTSWWTWGEVHGWQVAQLPEDTFPLFVGVLGALLQGITPLMRMTLAWGKRARDKGRGEPQGPLSPRLEWVVTSARCGKQREAALDLSALFCIGVNHTHITIYVRVWLDLCLLCTACFLLTRVSQRSALRQTSCGWTIA